MDMKDYKELYKVREDAMYALIGYVVPMLDHIRDGFTPSRKMWHEFDERRMAFECAQRDIENCFTTEAMVQSFKEEG